MDSHQLRELNHTARQTGRPQVAHLGAPVSSAQQTWRTVTWAGLACAIWALDALVLVAVAWAVKEVLS